jgi:hypothetical protein
MNTAHLRGSPSTLRVRTSRTAARLRARDTYLGLAERAWGDGDDPLCLDALGLV